MSRVPPPKPWPEGVTPERIDQLREMPVTKGEWRQYPGSICRTCGEPGYLHPHTNLIMGCPECNFSTLRVNFYFGFVELEPEPDDEGPSP